MLFVFFDKAYAQSTYVLDFKPNYRPVAAKLNQFILLDRRAKPDQMGEMMLSAGASKKVPVVLQQSLNEQFAKIFRSVVDASSSEKGQLIFRLSNMEYRTSHGFGGQKGTFALQAQVFSGKDERYTFLGNIDTLIQTNASEVAPKIVNLSSILIEELMRAYALKGASPSSDMTYLDVIHYERFLKRDIPLYHTNPLKEGIYWNYEQFKNQQPAAALEKVNDYAKRLSNAYYRDEKGKRRDAKGDAYAIVTADNVYIRGDYEYYPLVKKNDDFYFYGRFKGAPKNSENARMGYYVMFGLIGSLLYESMMGSEGSGNYIYLFKIDPHSGKFEPIDRVPVKVY